MDAAYESLFHIELRHPAIPSSIRPFHPSIHPSIHLSICLITYLSINLYLSVYLSTYLNLRQYIEPSLCLSFYVSIHLSVYALFHASIYSFLSFIHGWIVSFNIAYNRGVAMANFMSIKKIEPPTLLYFGSSGKYYDARITSAIETRRFDNTSKRARSPSPAVNYVSP